MLDFKLISVDSHMTEHPGCFERVQKEFPEKAPRVVENPPGIGKGLRPSIPARGKYDRPSLTAG